MQEINYVGFILICVLFGLYFLLLLYRLSVARINRNINAKSENRRRFYVNMFLQKRKIDCIDKDDVERYKIVKSMIKNRLHFYKLCSLGIIFLISIIYIFSFYEERKIYYRGTDDAIIYQNRLKNLKSIAMIEAKTNTRYNAREGKNIIEEIKKLKMELKQNYKQFSLEKDFVVVLDPGHGGRDPGAVSGKIYEKNIVLEVAKDIKRELKKEKIDALLTREIDIDLDNFERIRQTLKIRNFVFVSLHINTWKGKQTKGFDVFYYSGKKGEFYKEESKKFGEIVYGTLSQQDLVKNRKVRDANFGIIKYMNSVGPSLLIEMGFITNKNDYEVFTNPRKRRKFSKKLADGLELYVKNFYSETEELQK